MAKAIKLNLALDFNFILIGLVTSEPIYRVGWLINEKFGLQLTETKPVCLNHQKTNLKQVFSLFDYANEESGERYELIQNRGENGALIEEQKNIDFLLKVTDSTDDVIHLLSKIKEIKNINLAIEIQPGSLKSKNRLISFEENN